MMKDRSAAFLFILCFFIFNQVIQAEEWVEEMIPPPLDIEVRGTSLLWAGAPSHQTVALTFDDGPIPGKTEQLLAILQASQAPATFFLIGEKVQSHPELVRKMVAEGHEIGNHTNSHKNLSRISARDVFKEIKQCQEAIHSAAGFKPALFRAPYGAANMTTFSVLSHFGLTAVFWSVDTRDWDAKSSEQVSQRALDRLQNGDIILFHEHSRHTIGALQGIIDEVRAKGFTFQTISQMFGRTPAGPAAATLVAAPAPATAAQPEAASSTAAIASVAAAPHRPMPDFEDQSPPGEPEPPQTTVRSIRLEPSPVHSSESVEESSTAQEKGPGSAPQAAVPADTETPLPTLTATPTWTPIPTLAPSSTHTPTPTFTSTIPPTPTPTETGIPPTETSTPTSTPSETASPTATDTPAPPPLAAVLPKKHDPAKSVAAPIQSLPPAHPASGEVAPPPAPTAARKKPATPPSTVVLEGPEAGSISMELSHVDPQVTSNLSSKKPVQVSVPASPPPRHAMPHTPAAPPKEVLPPAPKLLPTPPPAAEASEASTGSKRVIRLNPVSQSGSKGKGMTAVAPAEPRLPRSRRILGNPPQETESTWGYSSPAER